MKYKDEKHEPVYYNKHIVFIKEFFASILLIIGSPSDTTTTRVSVDEQHKESLLVHMNVP